MRLKAGSLHVTGSRGKIVSSKRASVTMRTRICDSAEDLQLLGRGLCGPEQHGSKSFHSAGPLAHTVKPAKGGRLRTKAISGKGEALEEPSRDRSLDRITARLVAASTLPFLVLLLPQFIKNAQFIASGNPAALASLSWLGYLTGIGGNTLLLTYFTQKRETSAVFVQAIGIFSAFAVLTQMMVAQCIPRAVYLGVACMVATTAILTGLKLAGWLEQTKLGERVWAAWQKALGLAGLFAVPQVLCATCGIDPWLPTLAATGVGGALAIAEAAGVLPSALRDAWGALSAWTATLLFMLQPVAQLLKSFSTPGGLESLSLATICFAAVGNAFMVPRALYTGDVVWAVGSLWGSLVFGWGQMVALYLGRTAAGQHIMGSHAFGAATVLLWGWLVGAAILCLVRRKRQQHHAHAQ